VFDAYIHMYVVDSSQKMDIHSLGCRYTRTRAAVFTRVPSSPPIFTSCGGESGAGAYASAAVVPHIPACMDVIQHTRHERGNTVCQKALTAPDSPIMQCMFSWVGLVRYQPSATELFRHTYAITPVMATQVRDRMGGMMARCTQPRRSTRAHGTIDRYEKAVQRLASQRE